MLIKQMYYNSWSVLLSVKSLYQFSIKSYGDVDYFSTNMFLYEGFFCIWMKKNWSAICHFLFIIVSLCFETWRFSRATFIQIFHKSNKIYSAQNPNCWNCLNSYSSYFCSTKLLTTIGQTIQQWLFDITDLW